MSRPLLILAAFLCLMQLALKPAAARDYFVYIGTQSKSPNTGISLAHFDSDTGVLTAPKLILPVDGPSYFAISPNGQHLYSTNYTGPGGISSYSIDRASGSLKLLNHIDGGNFGTSHVSLDQTGRFALAANFDHGHIVTFPIQPDGSLGPKISSDHHDGSGINPLRQKVSYPHCIMIDPSNHFALVPDLGLDKLFIYRFDEKTGTLTANDPPFAPATSGFGPRHVRFHPNQKWVYLLCEMGNAIKAFNWNPAAGSLNEFQSISTLPENFKGESTAAELVIHPNGHFLYASNRGDDSIVVFAIDQTLGKLTLIQRIPSQGKTPRDFDLDSTGNWLICTNQDSDNAMVFNVDQATGKLTASGKPVDVPAPCGVIIAAIERR